MSSERKKPSKPSTSRTSRRSADEAPPVDAKLFTKARKVAEQYAIILEPHKRLGFFATCLELPTVFADGKTANECIETMREALSLAVAVMLEGGQAPPVPASEQRRSAQVNIRLTAQEKLLLERAAKQRGFRGVSDFVRNVAMSQLRRSA